MSDSTLIFIIIGLLLLAYVLRIFIAWKTKVSLTAFDLVQGLVLPVALGVVELIFRQTGRDFLVTVLAIGIIEELYFSGRRRKRQRVRQEDR